jgi:hypothetical protein
MNPKEALESLINLNVFPLLQDIEEAITNNHNHISGITGSGQYITNISIDSL